MRTDSRVGAIASGILIAGLLGTTAQAQRYHDPLAEAQTLEDYAEVLRSGNRRQKVLAGVRLADLAEANPNAAVTVLSPLVWSGNEDVRRIALEALRSTGAAALPTLIKALEHDQEKIQVAAARYLGMLRFEAEPAVGGLVTMLKDPSPASRQAAVHALRSIGPVAARRSVAPLFYLLDDPELGRSARSALLEIGPTPNRLQDLEGALLDPQPLMRQMAARHIGKRELEAFEVRPALREALQDPDPEVRRAARNALDDTSVWVAIQSERHTREEMIAILHRALSHEDPAVRIEAEQGLAQLGEPAG